MTGLLTSLFGSATAHSALTIGTVSVLLLWWLGVVLLTLREHRSTRTAPVVDQDLRAV